MGTYTGGASEGIYLCGYDQSSGKLAVEGVTPAQNPSFLALHPSGDALYAVNEPTFEWESPLAAFEAACAHEQRVTSLINNLVDIADEVGDHAAKVFLHWFLEEQVEEEASADAVVQKLRMVGDSPGGLFMLDREMAQRQPEAEQVDD